MREGFTCEGGHIQLEASRPLSFGFPRNFCLLEAAQRRKKY